MPQLVRRSRARPRLSRVRLVFVTGSGISVGAGMPSLQAITEQLLSGRNVTRQGGRFQIWDELPLQHEMWLDGVERTLGFLGELKAMCDAYFVRHDHERQTIYEDLAFVAQQIEDAIVGEYENPALVPLIERFTQSPYSGLTLEELRELAGGASDYIHETVRRMLARISGPVDYLAPILDAFEDDAVEQLDVFTLNHDVVMETALAERGLSYSDGFEEAWGTLRLWSDTYRHPTRRPFKLHGSIDWYRYDLDFGDWSGQRMARPIGDPEHPKGPGGEDLGARGCPCEGRPEFLAGTFNKILSYPTGIYADQHAHFHKSLREADALVVIGYGLRDKAINTRVIAWATRLETADWSWCTPTQMAWLSALDPRSRTSGLTGSRADCSGSSRGP